MKQHLLILLLIWLFGSLMVFLNMYLTAKGQDVYFLKYVAVITVFLMVTYALFVIILYFFRKRNT